MQRREDGFALLALSFGFGDEFTKLILLTFLQGGCRGGAADGPPVPGFVDHFAEDSTPKLMVISRIPGAFEVTWSALEMREMASASWFFTPGSSVILGLRFQVTNTAARASKVVAILFWRCI